jgi:uncharacterized protein YdeI (YjbR/CyaY-like superfamily)
VTIGHEPAYRGRAMNRAKSVDDYISNATRWQDELRQLRKILCSSGLTETVKWGAPCYTMDGKNVVGLIGFKAYFGLWYHQGALLKDTKNVLINAQEGKTRALRQWRMTSAKDIKPTVIKAYIRQAISLVKKGKEIKSERNKPITLPAELNNALRRQKGATAAFRQLRPGLQREYADYVADAKRDDTKRRRIEKIMPMIAAGIGMNDKYRQR